MQKSEKFFIFTWKEITVIALLVAISLGFFFTLGLHYGKKITVGEIAPEQRNAEGGGLEASPEVLPPREALEQGAQNAGGAADETIREATLKEIESSEVKLESPKQVELPREKTATARATDSSGSSSESPAESSAASSKYAIQLGSYPSKREAQVKVRALSKKGISTEIRTASVNGQLRFRVLIPGFSKKTQATARAREIAKKHQIANFIVIKAESDE